MKQAIKDSLILKIIIAIVVMGGLLVLAQIWDIGLPWEIFVKIIMSLGVIIVVLALIMIAKNEVDEHKRFKDKDLID